MVMMDYHLGSSIISPWSLTFKNEMLSVVKSA